MTLQYYWAIFQMFLVDHWPLGLFWSPPPPNASLSTPLFSAENPTSYFPAKVENIRWECLELPSPTAMFHIPFLCSLRKRAPPLSRLTANWHLTPVSTQTWLIGYALFPETTYWVIPLLPLTPWNETKWTKKTSLHLTYLLAATLHPSFPFMVKFL